MIVGADGDDISEPNRVSRIVEEWVKTGKKATVIFHDGWKIDGAGHVVGEIGLRTISAPLGACMAYSPKVVSDFPACSVRGCFQDHVLGRRGALIGDVLFIKDHLVRYRVGTGVSSVLQYRRGPELRAARARVAGCRQSLMDIDYCVNKGLIGESRHDSLRSEYEGYIVRNEDFIKLIEGSFRGRLASFVRLYGRSNSIRNGILRIPYLFPRAIGDFVYGVYDTLRAMRGRHKYSCVGCVDEKQ